MAPAGAGGTAHRPGTAAVILPLEPPVDIGRDAAADEARRELSKPIYNDGGESLFERAMNRVLEGIADLFADVAGRAPGGNAGLAILIGLIVLVIVVVIWRAGLVRRTAAGRVAVFGDGPVRSAAEYRAEAEAAAGRGDFAIAIRQRFRACVAELTERTVLDDRAGRTAYEVAVDAATAVPALGDPMQAAARVFAEVAYGDRPGTQQRYDVVVTADQAARTTSTRSLLQQAS